jgi:hypothetical protein
MKQRWDCFYSADHLLTALPDHVLPELSGARPAEWIVAKIDLVGTYLAWHKICVGDA